MMNSCQPLGTRQTPYGGLVSIHGPIHAQGDGYADHGHKQLQEPDVGWHRCADHKPEREIL